MLQYTNVSVTNVSSKSRYSIPLQFDYGISSKESLFGLKNKYSKIEHQNANYTSKKVQDKGDFTTTPFTFARVINYQFLDSSFFQHHSSFRSYLNLSSKGFSNLPYDYSIDLEAKNFFATSSFSQMTIPRLLSSLIISPSIFFGTSGVNSFIKASSVSKVVYTNEISSVVVNARFTLFKLAFISNSEIVNFPIFFGFGSSVISASEFTKHVSRVAQFSYGFYKSLFVKNVANFFSYFPEFVFKTHSTCSIKRTLPLVSYVSIRKNKNKNNYKVWRRVFRLQSWKKIQRLKRNVGSFNQRTARKNALGSDNRKLRTRKLSGFFFVKQKKIVRKIYSLIFFKSISKKQVNWTKKLSEKAFNIRSFSNKNIRTKKLYRHFFKPSNNTFSEVVPFNTINFQKKFSYQRGLPLLNASSTIEDSKNSPFRLSIKERENLFSNLSGTSVSFYRINALSLVRFDFELEKKEKEKQKQRARENKVSKDPLFKNEIIAKSNRTVVGVKKNKDISSAQFLQALQVERRRKYRYVGVYIPDLVRLSFISVYSKYAQLLINFFAFTLAKLPRNRKETKYIRFLVKLVKVFAGKRPEIVGLRLRFQGRINRWRRTKHILAQKGMLPLHTFEARISYGRAQAITRKGAFGRRLWIAYNPTFPLLYRRVFYNFIGASKKNILSVLLNFYL